MQSSIAPPLMTGLLSGAVAAAITVVVGGGWLLALGAYSLVGASGLVVSALATAPPQEGAAPARERGAESARRERPMAPGMATAEITVSARRG